MSWQALARRGVGAVVAGGALVLAGGWTLSAPGHVGAVSDHFDGVVFHNREPTPLPSLGRAVRDLRGFVDRGPWDPWREVAPQPPPPERVDEGGLRVTFVNHATTLVQLDGVNVLTDPIWSERCSPLPFAGPARHHAPGVALEELPPIDVVLISHNHYDHLDLPTLRALEAVHHPVVIAGLGNAPLLRGAGLARVVELDWEASTEVGPLRITGQETRHFTGRGLFDRQATLWLGFVVQGPSGAVYFGGDTGYGPHFARTGEAHGPFRLALLPIGAYAPRGFMGPIHMDPTQAVHAHRDLGAAASVGVHHGTFRLTSEGQDDPARELSSARARAGLAPDAFRVLQPGEGWDVP